MKNAKTPEQTSIAALRSLVIDMTNKARSGHPGMALDIAPTVYTLFRDFLISDPKDPEWINRDRFVLSSGHNSALLYATLHLFGYDVSMEDLKAFRQLGSRTPGHPERGYTPGVDATSGPLGQGIAQAVGMAMAEKALRAQYPSLEGTFGHYTYCLCGDGCLEEGISQEAISLAGHHRLDRLVLIYDANGATLDGPTNDSLSENVKLRFLASEWDVFEVEDGNDIKAIRKALAKAKASKGYPKLIIVHSTIGYGSKNQGSHKTHGEPLGEEDGANAKAIYGYPYPEFTVPAEVYQEARNEFVARGQEAHAQFNEGLQTAKALHPEEVERFQKAFSGDYSDIRLPQPEFAASEPTRGSSGKCLQVLHDALPNTFGGSADVAGSTKTNLKGETMFTPETPEGRDVHWGIREFAMAACCNGIALHGGLLPYASCFLVFADYLKPAVRMAALQKLRVFYLFTHDSIAVGEDGPTHQPIEQLAMLRSLPGLEVFRPCDGKETLAAYQAVLRKEPGPTALILSRQNLPQLEASSVEGALKGGYLIRQGKKPVLSLLSTGSEVALALDAAKLLEEKGIEVDVVSLPCLSRFQKQDKSYKDSILRLPYEKRISIEMASPFGWGDLAENHIGIEGFGASGKDKDVLAAYGFTPEAIAKKIEVFLGKR